MINIFDFVNQRVFGGDKVLDLGCGDKKIAKTLATENIVYVDVWPKAEPDIILDLNEAKLPFQDQEFDVVLMLDIIEHLDKCRGRALLPEVQRVTKREIILLTPLKWDDNKIPTRSPTSFYYQNQHNYHRSLWSKKDFPSGNGWQRHAVEHNFYYVGVWSR